MGQHETRIAGLHFSDARPAVGEEITIAGYLQWYDRKAKSWMPAEHKKVSLYVDSVKVAEATTDHSGRFEFRQSFGIGEHGIEVRFDGIPGYEASQASRKIKVITAHQKERVRKLVRSAVIIGVLLIFVFMVLSIFFVR
ncbi:hypothetical protein [Archaeoglobus veneficus]|uniref:Carboxypeptidase regulatory-like domain-containing protein n=1 Tax=Archaeoglobus veneficus (strain DSM 11195 / SNP6) TaxID=693661 RepID=F2KSR1_ARCVS|nr:hypothetical protein [Archaeoglobus veneficus]AEA46956.1 hypothetical protein Arcve_0945 [Archaeoglobus veneficus SNP6]